MKMMAAAGAVLMMNMTAVAEELVRGGYGTRYTMTRSRAAAAERPERRTVRTAGRKMASCLLPPLAALLASCGSSLILFKGSVVLTKRGPLTTWSTVVMV